MLANLQDFHFLHKWLLNYLMDRTDILQYPDQFLAHIQNVVSVLNSTEIFFNKTNERKIKLMRVKLKKHGLFFLCNYTNYFDIIF